MTKRVNCGVYEMAGFSFCTNSVCLGGYNRVLFSYVCGGYASVGLNWGQKMVG